MSSYLYLLYLYSFRYFSLALVFGKNWTFTDLYKILALYMSVWETHKQVYELCFGMWDVMVLVDCSAGQNTTSKLHNYCVHYVTPSLHHYTHGALLPDVWLLVHKPKGLLISMRKLLMFWQNINLILPKYLYSMLVAFPSAIYNNTTVLIWRLLWVTTDVY